MSGEWWTFPRIDNLGSPDPYGGFPKPDSNIQLPDRYPIIIPPGLSGIVTWVDTKSSWGTAITIRLDSALNTLATHTAYLHLASANVSIGQHVTVGQLIGVNGGKAASGAQKVPLGFALYHGDRYGLDAGWTYETVANVTGLLNPVPLLEALKKGQSVNMLTLSSGDSTALYSFYSQAGTPLSSTKVHELLNNVPGFKRIVEALDTAEQFQPFELKGSGGQDIGILGHLPFIGKDLQNEANIVTLPSDTIQAVLTFIVGNTLATSIRGLLIFIGLVIVIALMYNALQPVIETGMDVGKTVGSIVGKAAVVAA